MIPRPALVLLFLLGLAVRLPMLLGYEGVHGGDSAARLAHSDRLVLAYQLPLPQLVVVALRRLAPHPFWTRLAFALIGAAVAPLLARVVARLESPQAGIVAGIFVTAHPLLAYYSLVPYQEGPMIALLLAGAAALLDGRERQAGLWIGLASLCRYEAWIAAALAVGRRPSIRTALLHGWAPLAWLLLWRGLAPEGTYVLDIDPSAGRLRRLPFLMSKLSAYTGPLVLAGAVPGLALLLWRGDRRWRWGAAFIAGVLLVIVLVGQEFPPGSGHLSERLAHVPAVAVCVGAAVLLARAARTSTPGRAAVAALTAIVVVGWIRYTYAALDRANRDPELRLAVEVARFADRTLGASGRLAVAAPQVPASFLSAFIHKVGAAGGNTTRARETAQEFTRLTPDGVRVAAHLARRPGTVVAPGAPAALIAVFDEVAAGPPPGARIVARFAAPPRGVTVYQSFPDGSRIDSAAPAD